MTDNSDEPLAGAKGEMPPFLKTKSNMIDFIVDRRLGFAACAALDNAAPSSSIEYQSLASKVTKHRKPLYSMSDDELSMMFEVELEELEKEEKAFFAPLPPSELKQMASADSWSLEEAVSLCFGIRPNDSLQGWSDSNRGICAKAAEFFALSDMVRRARQVQHLEDPILPADFVAWAEKKGYSFPPELLKAMHRESSADWQAKYEAAEKEIAKLRARNSALEKDIKKGRSNSFNRTLQVIAVAATRNYQFMPDKDRNDAAKIISDTLLRNHGVKLTAKTILGYIRAVSCLNESWGIPESGLV